MNLIIRNIELEDYDKKYLELLNQLTDCPKIDYKDFEKIFKKIRENIFVIEDLVEKKIIASGTLLIEQKFIHQGGLVGHMEDIVIDKDYRGKNLGKMLVNHLIEYGKNKNCYKIIADCKENLVFFYEKTGFKKNGAQISIYF